MGDNVIQDIPVEIFVQCIDEVRPLDRFTWDDIPFEIQKYWLGGLTDPLGQLIKWLHDEIVDWIEDAKNTIKTHIGTVLDSLWSKIKDAFASLSSKLESVFWDLSTRLQRFTTSIINTVSSGLQSAMNTITNITTRLKSAFTNALNIVYEKITRVIGIVREYIGSAMTWIRNVFQHISSAIHNAISTIGSYVTQIYMHIKTGFATLLNAVTGIPEEVWVRVKGAIEGFIETFTEFWQKTTNFFRDIYEKLRLAIVDVHRVLTGFVNPLIHIYEVLRGAWLDLRNFLNMVTGLLKIEELKEKIISIWAFIRTKAVDIAKTVWGSLRGLITWIGEHVLEPLWSAAFHRSPGLIDWIKSKFESVIEAFIRKTAYPISALFGTIDKVVPTWLGPGTPPTAFKIAMDTVIEATLRQSIPVMAIGYAIQGVADIIETHVEAEGYGGSLKAEWLRELGKNIVRVGREMLEDLMFWMLMKPTEILARGILAHITWAEVPTINEAIELLNRGLWDENKLRWVVMSRGYHKSFADVILSEQSVELETRALKMFGEEIKEKAFIRLGLRWRMPSVSDLCRFMVKDIFLRPEDFIKCMALHGVPPHQAYAYYLLHFKYPSLDRLWEFYCRVKAHEWLSQHGTTIKEFLWYQPLIQAGVKSADVEYALKKYLKWQDYCDISWFKGDDRAGTMQKVSDQMIMAEMMADIPQRIDARWMYKWGLITDEELKGIVLARGMHFKWVDLITVAECMNALAEERTYARTGVLNLYELGALKPEKVDQILQNLTKVKILGKEYTVKFLDGERKLLILRHDYDRAQKVFKVALDAVSDAVRDNIIGADDGIKVLEGFVKGHAQMMKVPIELDSVYLKALLDAYQMHNIVYRVRRIRSWMWTFVSRVSQLAEYGCRSIDEVLTEVERFGKTAHLSDEEIALIKDIVRISYEAYRWREWRTIKRREIINKFKRGLIDYSTAIRELTKVGYTEDEARALVEAEVRVYEPTLTMLATLAEVVPEARKLFRKVAEIRGVPKDELPIWEKYIILRPLVDEVRRYVSELISDYAAGVIDDMTFNRLLNDLKQFGYEDAEIEIIKRIARLRRQRYMARRRS